MTDCFDKNMTALDKCYPEASRCIRKLYEANCEVSEDGCFTGEDGIIVNTEDVCGKQVLAVTAGGKLFQLDSLYDDKPLLDLWFKGLREDWPLDAKLLMFGFGSGAFARHYLKAAREDCGIVIHEPSLKVFCKVINSFDITDLLNDKRVTFVFGFLICGKSVAKCYEDILSYVDMQYLTLSYYPNYIQCFNRQAEEFALGITELKEIYAASKNVYNRFGGYFSRNALCNFKHVTDSLSYESLKRVVPKDAPAIIVSAGPSLDKNIDELKRAQGKAFIIATITALKPLALKGIKADLAVITDGKKDLRYMSEEASRSVPMVCSLVCGYDILELQQGVKFFFNDSCNHINKFMQEHGILFEELDGGGSVANACYTIARECGLKTVILVGQDLAYTGDKTHSAVTVRGQWNTKAEDLEHPLWDEDIYGNPIRTSREFKVYVKWFEERFKENPDIEVIDATEGGIKIKGSRIMTLKAAIDEFCNKEYDFDGALSLAEALFNESEKSEFKEYIRQVPGQFSELKRVIKETMADYASMRRLVETNRYKSKEMLSLYKRCSDNTKRVEDSPVIEYVHNQLKEKSSEVLASVNNLEQDERAELLAVCDIGSKYLEDMQKAIEELSPFVEEIKGDFKR